MKYLWLLSLLLLSTSAYAQFDIYGEGTVTLVNGKSQPFDFGFSYFRQDGKYRFIVGRQSVMVPSLPRKYSLAIVLQDEKQVWVADFINEPLTGFDFKLEQYQIKLYQDSNLANARGGFVLQLNDERYFFNRGPGQINFIFTEQGLEEVWIEGMFKPAR